jgi:hypothetical protein
MDVGRGAGARARITGNDQNTPFSFSLQTCPSKTGGDTETEDDGEDEEDEEDEEEILVDSRARQAARQDVLQILGSSPRKFFKTNRAMFRRGWVGMSEWIDTMLFPSVRRKEMDHCRAVQNEKIASAMAIKRALERSALERQDEKASASFFASVAAQETELRARQDAARAAFDEKLAEARSAADERAASDWKALHRKHSSDRRELEDRVTRARRQVVDDQRRNKDVDEAKLKEAVSSERQRKTFYANVSAECLALEQQTKKENARIDDEATREWRTLEEQFAEQHAALQASVATFKDQHAARVASRPARVEQQLAPVYEALKQDARQAVRDAAAFCVAVERSLCRVEELKVRFSAFELAECLRKRKAAATLKRRREE